MPLIKSAKKAIRSDAKKAVFNVRKKRAMKLAEKQVRDMVLRKKAPEAKSALPLAYKAIDKAMKVGIIKKNTASRKKSRLTKAVKKIS